MGIWTWPFIFVVAVITFICIAAERKTKTAGALLEGRDEINEAIEEHPFMLNPIIWIALVAVAFMGIVIIYYAASF